MNVDFVSAIKNIAPFIAGTFGTPFVGAAVAAICQAIPDQAPAIQAAHAADPVSGAVNKLGELLQAGTINAVQIKAAELNHVENMTQWGYKNVTDLEGIAAGDRADARKREITLRDKTPTVLATIIVLGAIIISVAIVSGNAPAMKDAATAALAGAIVGYIFAELKQVFNYYFGTSASSKAKDETIQAMVKNGS
jgi:hypothetical protein